MDYNTPDHAVFFPQDDLVVVFNQDGDILGAEIPAESLEEALEVLQQNGYSEFTEVEYLDDDVVAIHKG